MERDCADVSALRAALAEGHRLRAELDAAAGVIGRLRGEAQAATQAKADFMARMTHEMRTPLTAIIGLANLAAPLAEDPALLDYLDKIVTSARSLLEVVDDITDFSRLEKGLVGLNPQPFDLDQSLGRIVRAFASAAEGKGLTLSTRRDPAIPSRLVGDHGRLEGVLSHLVGNAVKFTEAGGVEIAVDLRGRSDGKVRLAFGVRDTGIGMAPEALPDLLESFTQADGSLSRPYGGTGLGLAIVRRVLDLLGGEFSVVSSPGQGAEFRFELVFAEDRETAAAPDLGARASLPAADIVAAGPGRGPEKPLSGSLILLVEDNAINQQVAREVLERFGAATEVAQNGREAVEKVQARPYDVVLMDVQMPVMDGLAATRRIRSLPGGRELPIVALTAHALAEDRDRCLEAGMNDYLTKPIEPDRLLASLGQWIAPAAEAARARQAARTSGRPFAFPAPDAKTSPAPALDVRAALGRLGGNERLLLNVAAEFARDYADAADALERLVAAGDLAEARRLAHTLKGVAGNLSADALAAVARDMEVVLAGGQSPPPGRVAAFRSALAAAVEAASRLGEPCPAPPAEGAAARWRILLVDDAKLNQAIFGQILRGAGHEVVTAGNGKEACRLLFGEKTGERPFDLILMDIEMPELDGPAASRLIRKLLSASVSPPCPPGIPILALTSHDPAGERDRCLAAGMNECLPKVFEAQELLAAITRAMTGREFPVARPSRAAPLPVVGAALGPLLRRMAGHLAEGSIRADEDLAVLREAMTGRPAPAELKELSLAVERYEFALALDILGRLAADLGIDPGAFAAQGGEAPPGAVPDGWERGV